MDKNRSVSRTAAFALAIVLAGASPVLLAAQSDGEGPEPGGGAMAGYGMGPGMMGGYGYGMGPWMMGGCGFGMGPGMMAPFGAPGLHLADQQEAKINHIMDATRKAHWAIMGQMMDEQAKLRDLYAAPKRDDAAIGAAYKAIGRLRQQMFESSVDARKQVDAVLTEEQREQLRNYWRQGWGMRP